MTTSPTAPGRREPGTAPVLNVANVLTVLRIVLVPVFCVLFFADGAHSTGWRIAAFVAFAVAMMTDYVDGYLARRHDLVTDFGKLADPIADKALLGAAMISLSLVGELYWWVTVVVFVREIGITLWRLFGVDHVVAASPGGKLKTVTQSVALPLYLLGLQNLPVWLQWMSMGIMWLALALTLVTGADYIRSAMKIRRDAIAAGTRRK